MFARLRDLDNLLVVEILTEVDVEDSLTIFRGGIEETVDGITRHLVALRERSEADSTTLLCQCLYLWGEWDIVPCLSLIHI